MIDRCVLLDVRPMVDRRGGIRGLAGCREWQRGAESAVVDISARHPKASGDRKLAFARCRRHLVRRPHFIEGADLAAPHRASHRLGRDGLLNSLRATLFVKLGGSPTAFTTAREAGRAVLS